MKEVTIEKLGSEEDMPYDLLLLADETLEAIHKYADRSNVYVARNECSLMPIAAFVIKISNDSEMEIWNIAVAPEFQGKGLGSYLIKWICLFAQLNNCKIIWVGTPDSESRQINFYQKNGFKISEIVKNYFVDNYPEPIFENGTYLKDMVLFKREL
jgi:ribosomal protein S18 acetylase RimI-like enzyme